MNKKLFLIPLIFLSTYSCELKHQTSESNQSEIELPKTRSTISAWVAVMRHGQSEHNIQRVANSNPDSPKYFISNLTEEGRATVRRSASKLKNKRSFRKENVEATYTSPLPRTRQTTDILVQEGVSAPKRIILDDRLIEIQMGDRESEPHRALTDSWDHSNFEEYNGESPEHVKERISSFYNDLIKTARSRTSSVDSASSTESNTSERKNYIVVTHGTPAKELVELITGKSLRLKPGQTKVYPINALSVPEEQEGE